MDKAREVLRDTFGLQAFREGQEWIIRRLIVDNESAAFIMPTGGGKSLCYQLPALLFENLTLVICPLISLMKDQVDKLRRLNIKAASLDSSLSLEETIETKQAIRNGTLKILYVAPERLNNEAFLAMLNGIKMDLMAIDESHCISEWGHTFRPDYLKVARFAREYKPKRVLALTATATPAVAAGICRAFGINEAEGLLRIPSYRPNLSLKVVSTSNQNDKIDELKRRLPPESCGATIIYVTKQAEAEEVMRVMESLGHSVKFYHAGVETEERKSVQNWFMDTTHSRVVVATIAFGMGVDKADIRNVLHYKMPKSLESLSQEIGRAGRDGLPSTCTMLVCQADIPVLEGFIRGETPTLSAIRMLLADIFQNPKAVEGDTIDVSFYDQAAQFDILLAIVHVIYTYLDLHHHILREVTPYYKEYKFKLLGTQHLSDPTAEARHIREFMIDTDRICREVDVERSAIIATLVSWEINRWIDLEVSGVRHEYQLLQDAPDIAALDKIAQNIYNYMVEREKKDIGRLRQVMHYATHKSCLARKLADYFGDAEFVPPGGCETCTWCTTGTPIALTEPKLHSDADVFEAVKPILHACPVRDDPRFLARVAFGINSPRIRKLNLKKEAIFGSLESVDFDQLLRVFTKICADCNGRNTNGIEDYGLRPKKEVLSPEKAQSLSPKKRRRSSLTELPSPTKTFRGSSSRPLD